MAKRMYSEKEVREIAEAGHTYKVLLACVGRYIDVSESMARTLGSMKKYPAFFRNEIASLEGRKK